MTLQLNICSNLICPAPKLASAWVAGQPYGHAVMALLGASLLFVTALQVIESTMLATSSIP